MRSIANWMLGATLGLLLTVYVTGCAGGVAVGANGGYYDYDYYPNSEVYYYPTGSTYYWRDHDAWHHGRDLPHNFDIRNENKVPLHLKTSRPFEMHNQTRTQYPRHEEEHH